MTAPVSTRGGAAFKRLLQEASVNEQARVDALVALSQRTVWVATWEPKSPAYRVLEHEAGGVGLAVFTDEEELQRAASTLGWSASGPVRAKEIGAREALHTVVVQQMDYLLVDVCSDHALEASRAELEPLASLRSRSDSQGPYAGVGRISSTMLEAVRATGGSSPGTVGAERRSSAPPLGTGLPLGSRPPTQPPSSIRAPTLPPATLATMTTSATSAASAGRAAMPAPAPATPAPATHGASPSMRSASRPPSAPPPVIPRAPAVPQFSPSVMPSASAALPAHRQSQMPPSVLLDTTATLVHVTFEPNAAMLDACSAFLKGFPEVEWAAFCLASISGQEPQPMIGVRVDPSFPQRIPDIVRGIESLPETSGANIRVLLLEKLVKTARLEGIPFHPWRRRKTGQV